MTENGTQTPVRSYGCTFGCGNPYDYILISVADGTTEFLCLLCFARLVGTIIEAVTNPDAPEVQEAMREMGQLQRAQANGSTPKDRGHNAPVTLDDPDLIAAFDDRITADELPEQFK